MSVTNDRSAPGVRITLMPDEHARTGEPLDLTGRILSFAFEDAGSKADKVVITLDNFDLSLFDREDLVGGAILQVSWGYAGNMAVPRRVVVKKLKGFTTLEVEGHALSVLMNREARTRQWENRTRSQVAQEIAREHGYQGTYLHVEDGGTPVDVINQTAETDAQLLRRLAARQGWQFYVDDTGFHFHGPRQEEAPVRTCIWYADPGQGDVLSIQMESDLTRRTGKVTVKGRDPLRKTTVEQSAANESTDRTTLGTVIEVVDPETGQTALQTRNATASVRPSPAPTDDKANQEAKARFKGAERQSIKLSMQVVGDPSLRAKTVVQVQGISSLLSGNYYVDEVKHVISSSGYVCELKLTRDGQGRRRRQAPQEGRTSQGQHNNANPPEDGSLTPVEMVDPETGQTRIEYRNDNRTPTATGDPEARGVSGGAR